MTRNAESILAAEAGEIRRELRRVIAGGLLRVVFQPIIEFRTGRITAREGLIRPPADSPFRHAGELFEAAERVEMLWEFERACREATFAAAETLPHGEFLFTNVTPEVFSDPRLLDELHSMCRGSGRFDPAHVTVELTERNETSSMEVLAAQADALRERGFQFAIDDVGAGTSGLNRIMRLRPNWLKLDRELVSNLHTDPFRRNLIQFFVHFARLSSMLLLAEGIEREEELRTAIELGVSFGQGFLMARPAGVKQSIDPLWYEVIPNIRDRMEARRFEDPRLAPIGELTQPLITCPASTTLGEAIATIGQLHEAQALAIVDGTRVLGWTTVNALRERAQAAPADPLARLCRPGVIVARPDMTVSETIDWAVLRPDHEIMEPILVASEDVVGLVSMRTLLVAAGKMRPEGSPHTSSLTGLPDRVQMDAQMERRLGRGEASAAAMIDLRVFHAYNRAYGFEMGDAMLRQLAALLMLEFGERDSDEFIAHHADDHFFVLSNRRDLKVRLKLVAAEFDRSRGEFFSADDLKKGSFSIAGACDEGARPLCSLRIFIVPEITGVARSTGDLLELARRARRIEKRSDCTAASTLRVIRLGKRSQRGKRRAA